MRILVITEKVISGKGFKYTNVPKKALVGTAPLRDMVAVERLRQTALMRANLGYHIQVSTATAPKGTRIQQSYDRRLEQEVSYLYPFPDGRELTNWRSVGKMRPTKLMRYCPECHTMMRRFDLPSGDDVEFYCPACAQCVRVEITGDTLPF